MMSRIIRLQSNTWWIGIILLILSALCFWIFSQSQSDNNGGIFILNFGLTVAIF